METPLPTAAPPTTSDLARQANFLLDLAQALHLSGLHSYELERQLNAVGNQLGVRVVCFAVLTMLTLNLTAEDGTQKVVMTRLPPYDYNMARLIALEDMLTRIEGPNCLERIESELKTIMGTPPLWTGWSFVFFGFLLSAGVAVLLRGGWVEMACGGVIGALFVRSFLALAPYPRLGPAIPVILCALAALLAHLSAIVLPQQSPFITSVAGVVFLLPGFMLTVAMSELATQNLLAGTGRLAGVFLLLFLMGAGLAIGTEIGTHLVPEHATGAPLPLPSWIVWPAIVVLGLSMLGVLQAPWRSTHALIIGCLLTWSVFSIVNTGFGMIVGAFAGALAVGFAGHFYNALTGKPAILVKIPGIITLVPGSVGFRGLHALMEQDSATGVGLLTDMVITGAVLAVGLLLADNLGPPVFKRLRHERKRLRAALRARRSQ